MSQLPEDYLVTVRVPRMYLSRLIDHVSYDAEGEPVGSWSIEKIERPE